MKKVTALALLLGMSIYAFAQNSDKQASDPKYRTWSIGLDLGANWLLGDMYAAETNKEEFNNEWGKAGLAINANLAKWINSAFGVQGRLGYASYSGTRTRYAFEATSAFRTELNVLMNLNGFGARNRSVERKDAWVFHTGIGANFADAEVFKDGQDLFVLGENAQFQFFDRDKNGTTLRTWYLPFGLEWRYRIAPRFDVSAGVSAMWFMDDNADGSATLQVEEPQFSDARYLKTVFPNASNDFLVRMNVGVNYFFALKTPKNTDVIIYTDGMAELAERIGKNEGNIASLMKDDDGDGVSDYFDKEPNTPKDARVTGAGQAQDSDGDGVPDYMDEDPFSTKGATVEANGREIDSDGDGVPDSRDIEPTTPKGSFVNYQGVTIVDKVGGGAAASGEAFLPNVYFDFNKSNVSSANYERLAVVARFMESNKNVRMRVVGHTDRVGTEVYNVKLSDRRAAAAINALVNDFGIDRSRFEAEGKGKSQLWSKRDDINRRVEFQVVK